MFVQESTRNQRWRLGILRHAGEVTHNVAKTSRYFGISRTAYYRWLERYQECGEEGLLDWSRRPKHSPGVNEPDIRAKISYHRQAYRFGPWKIIVYLERYYDIHIRRSGVWRILKRLQMSRLRSNQWYKSHLERWKRYEKPRRPRLNGKVERSPRIDEEEFFVCLKGKRLIMPTYSMKNCGIGSTFMTITGQTLSGVAKRLMNDFEKKPAFVCERFPSVPHRHIFYGYSVFFFILIIL